MKKVNKLVRDNVVEFIKRDGHTPTYRELSKEEYQKALLQQLTEEASEVAMATDDLERLVELGDVIEIIDAIREAYDIDPGDLTRAQTRKRNERGSYNKRIYLESIDEQ